MGGNYASHVFRIEAGGHRGRAHEIAEHHGELTALGAVVRLRLDLGGWLAPSALLPVGAAQTCDRLEQPLPVPQEHAELFEIRVGQVGQDFGVNTVLFERRLILVKPQAP
jgi:hypothetical protein